MKYYNLVLDEREKHTLLRSLGDSCDNAVNKSDEDLFKALFDSVMASQESGEDFMWFYEVSKKSVGLMGNELLKVMRQIVECEENGRSGDVSWHRHELCAMIRGICSAGFDVSVKPQPGGSFRCIEVEGMSFKV